MTRPIEYWVVGATEVRTELNFISLAKTATIAVLQPDKKNDTSESGYWGEVFKWKNLNNGPSD